MLKIVVAIALSFISTGKTAAEDWFDPDTEVTQAIIMFAAEGRCNFLGLDAALATAMERAERKVGKKEATERVVRGFMILFERSVNDNAALCKGAFDLAQAYKEGH